MSASAIVRCKACGVWERSDTDPKRGRCLLNPPHVEMVPVQTLQGQGLSAVAVYPETRERDGCTKGQPSQLEPQNVLAV